MPAHPTLIDYIINFAPAVSAFASCVSILFIIIQININRKQEMGRRDFSSFQERERVRPLLTIGFADRIKDGVTVHYLIHKDITKDDNGKIKRNIHLEKFPAEISKAIIDHLAIQENRNLLESDTFYVADNKTDKNLLYLKNSSINDMYKCTILVTFNIGGIGYSETYSFDSLKSGEITYIDPLFHQLSNLDYELEKLVINFETVIKEHGKMIFDVLVSPIRNNNIVLNNPKEIYEFEYDKSKQAVITNPISDINLDTDYIQAATHVHSINNSHSGD